jgi:hypothetical protein
MIGPFDREDLRCRLFGGAAPEMDVALMLAPHLHLGAVQSKPKDYISESHLVACRFCPTRSSMPDQSTFASVLLRSATF